MERFADRPSRKKWERAWDQHAESDFEWYLKEPPAELVRLLAGRVPEGAALDIGCGSGIAARYISRFLHPTVGIDISTAAVKIASDLAREAGTPTSFLAAEAPLFPFRDQRFALIFDRGCIHNIARRLWPVYFREADRLLKDGGFLQIVAPKPKPPPRARSLRGFLLWLIHPVRMSRRRKGAMYFEDRLKGHIPRSLEVLETRHVPFQTKSGHWRTFIHILSRKRTSDTEAA